MKSRLLLFAFAAIVLVAIVAWALFRPKPPADPPREDFTKLQDKLEQLERDVSKSSARLQNAEQDARRAQQRYESRAAEMFDGASAQPATSQTPSQAVEAANTLPAEAPTEDPRDADPLVLSERLDNVFFDESSDPAWTPEATQSAERLASSMGQHAAVSSVECRASLCRLESTFADLTSFQASAVDALTNPDTGWPGPYMAAVVSDPHEEGAVDVVIYLGRDGVDLSPEGLAAGE